MTAQPVAAPVDAETASLLALIAGDPIHATDRATITAAIVEAAHRGNGVVSMNTVRTRLWNEHGSVVYPKVVGAVVAALRHQGVLVPAGWEVTEGSRSGNTGKPCRSYTYTPMLPAETFPAAGTTEGRVEHLPAPRPSVTSGGAS